MSKDEKFEYDLKCVKKDLAIEGLYLSEEDVKLIKRYLNKEISINELVRIILAR